MDPASPKKLPKTKSPAELIVSRRSCFKNNLVLATELLKNGDHFNSEILYGSILSDLHDNRIDELELNDLELFSLHCCFAYCCIAVEYRSDKGMVLLNSLRKSIQLPMVPFLKAFVHVGLENFSSANQELSLCKKMMDDGYNFKPNHILNEDVVPEINEAFLKKKLNGLYVTIDCLMTKDVPTFRRDFRERFMLLGSLREIDYASRKVLTAVNEQGTSTEQPKCQSSIQTETGAVKKAKPTPRSKTTNASVQTMVTKYADAATQSEKDNVNKEMMGTLMDIKNKVNNLQSKKVDEVKKLQKKVNELNDKLLAKDKRTQEFEFIKQRFTSMETRLESSQQDIVLLQRILVEQNKQKYQLQKRLLAMCEEMCVSKIGYLRGIQNNLYAGAGFTAEDFMGDEMMWRDKLAVVLEKRRQSEEWRERMDSFGRAPSLMQLSKVHESLDFPQLPDVPETVLDANDIVHRSFKELLERGRQNSIWTSRPNTADKPSALDRCGPDGSTIASYVIGHSAVFPSSLFRQHYEALHPVNRYSQDDRTTGSPPPSSSSSQSEGACTLPNPVGTRSKKPKMRLKSEESGESDKGPVGYDSEKKLFHFLEQNFKDLDEIELLNSVYQVRDANNGTLVGLSRDQLVSDIKKNLKKDREPKGWSVAGPSQRWHNDHSESRCCICFDDYTPQTSYVLSCQHEFHKKCIKSWLQRQSACPMCRVHVVFDDDFPPL